MPQDTRVRTRVPQSAKPKFLGGEELRSKVILVAMALGFINGAIAAGVSYYLNSHDSIDVGVLGAWEDYAIWVWPSAIMMMVTDHLDPAENNPFTQGVALLFSLMTNAGLYGVAGLVIGAVWEKLRAATSASGRG